MNFSLCSSLLLWLLLAKGAAGQELNATTGFLSQPQHVNATVGETVEFECRSAIGGFLVWFQEDLLLTTENISLFNPIKYSVQYNEKLHQSQLRINGVALDDSGNFICRIVGLVGRDRCQYSTLNVLESVHHQPESTRKTPENLFPWLAIILATVVALVLIIIGTIRVCKIHNISNERICLIKR